MIYLQNHQLFYTKNTNFVLRWKKAVETLDVRIHFEHKRWSNVKIYETKQQTKQYEERKKHIFANKYSSNPAYRRAFR